MEKPKIKLNYPVEWDGGTVSELEFSRLTAKDIRSISSTPKMADMLDLAQASCGMPKNFIDRLDASDAMKCAEVIGDFL